MTRKAREVRAWGRQPEDLCPPGYTYERRIVHSPLIVVSIGQYPLYVRSRDGYAEQLVSVRIEDKP